LELEEACADFEREVCEECLLRKEEPFLGTLALKEDGCLEFEFNLRFSLDDESLWPEDLRVLLCRGGSLLEDDAASEFSDWDDDATSECSDEARFDMPLLDDEEDFLHCGGDSLSVCSDSEEEARLDFDLPFAFVVDDEGL